jgi:putative intracellular protease/amidase
MRVFVAFALSLFWVSNLAAAQTLVPGQRLTPPRTGTIKVAFLIGEGATVIDFAGPWEVFGYTQLGDDRQTEEANPFELYTVASSKTPIHTEGGHRPGMTITPDFDFSTAPMPDVVVVGAFVAGPGTNEWLQKMHGENRIVMSVCTGAFKLARAGLLDGRSATTHHWHFNQFQRLFPKVELVRGVRYAESESGIYTAGGALAGVDLALHIVQEYFGTAQAQAVADRIEWQSDGWKTNVGVNTPVPVVHEEWHGDLAPGLLVNVHIAIQGPDLSATMDSAGLHVAGVPTTISTAGATVRMTFGDSGHPSAMFVGTDNDADDTLTGTFTQHGKSTPLTLLKDKRVPVPYVR